MKQITLKIVAVLMCIAGSYYGQLNPDDTVALRKMIDKYKTGTVAIFEGEVEGEDSPIVDAQGQIWTIFKVRVDYVNYGSATGSQIKIAKLGGRLTGSSNRQSIVMDDQPLAKVNTFILNSGMKVTDDATAVEYYQMQNVPYDDDYNITIYDPFYPIHHANELNSYLAMVLPGYTYLTHKPVRQEQMPEPIPYSESSKNFWDRVNAKSGLGKQQNKNANSSSIEDIELQLQNPTITGVSPRYFEFDVFVRGSSSTTYLDNVPVHLSYNTSAFGSNIITPGNVQIQNGTGFNNANYYAGSTALTNISSNVFAFAITAGPSLTPNRTQLTTSFQKLAHVKIKLTTCGNNTNVNLTNNATAINSCVYSTVANSSNIFAYDNLIYSGSAMNLTYNCGPTIVNFTSPVRGGVYDTLVIKGYNFGTTKGDVYFKNADNGGNTIVPADTNDYIGTWKDTLIKIRVPSFITALYPQSQMNNSPGTGNFNIQTFGGQIVSSGLNSSGQPFKVNYSLMAVDDMNAPGGIKPKYNLYGQAPNNNYKLICDTSIGRYPNRFKILKKAIRDWACLTTYNCELEYDSTISNSPSVNFIKFTNFGASATWARTQVQPARCTTTGHGLILEFDIEINSNAGVTMFYDTTGATLPANMVDYYEIVSHEIGHAMGQRHIIDTTSLLYWAGKKTTNPAGIAGIYRRKVQPYTAEVDAGLYQMSNSIATINSADGTCGVVDIQPNNSNICSGYTAIREYGSNQLRASVYPNPSPDGRVTVEYSTSGNGDSYIEVYDVTGKNLFSETVKSEFSVRKEMYLQDLNAGLYILKISSGNQASTFKLIKN